MSVFVDTSALYALLNRNDEFHRAAAAWWADRLPAGERMVSSEWVLVETGTVLQRRLGAAGVRALRDDLLPVVEVLAVDTSVRDAALAAVIDSGSKQVSLVDRSSLELMRRRAIDQVFSFDPDFVAAGFETVPPPLQARRAPKPPIEAARGTATDRDRGPEPPRLTP